MNKGRELFILTQAGCLPFSFVKTEGEATEICPMLRRSNDPDFIHVIEYQAYKKVLESLKALVNSQVVKQAEFIGYSEAYLIAVETLTELGEHE